MKRSELRRDPESTRLWQQRSREKAIEQARGREGMRSMALRMSTAEALAPIAAPKAPEVRRARRSRTKVRIPRGVRNAALARSEGRCVVCVDRLRRAGKRPGSANRAVHVHHVLEERNYPHLALIVDNLVGVCPGCHWGHENASERMPRSALPDCAVQLAEVHGLGWVIERNYLP